MSEFVHVAVDAMGGDNAPSEIVKGSVNALNSCPNLKVTFTGKEELVKAAFEKAGLTIIEVMHDGEWCCVIAGKDKI